jgi:ribose transport system ATP-binding protein
MMPFAPHARSPLAITVSGLSKRFPGVVALDDVTLAFEPGAVTAVVGENGAGKSTLMTILGGLQRPDAGQVRIGGELVTTFTPHELLVRHGVALVPQNIALARERTVAENVLLGREDRRLPSRREMVSRTRELLERIETPIDPHRRAGTLTVAEQQLVVIARALARDCGVLILDEPSTSLTPEEVGRLFSLLRRLQGDTTIIYVSHRLPEVFEVSERIHVLRDGSLAASYATAEVDSMTLVQAMVGRKLAARTRARSSVPNRPTVSVTGLSAPGFHDISFEVGESEIVGLAGLPDSGRRELLAALFGAEPSSGSVELNGVAQRLRGPRDAIAAGIAYVPAERTAEGLFPEMTVAGNLAVLDLDSLARGGVIRRSAVRRLASERVAAFDIKGTEGSRITQLSGGNQQKVILARWLVREPRLLLLDEPTRGVDVGAKAEIYARLESAAHAGTAIVMSSSDLPELLRCCDRIVVMLRGRIAGTLSAAEATEESVMALATGVALGAAA